MAISLALGKKARSCNTGFPQSLLEENSIDAYRKLGERDKKEDLQKKMRSLSRVVIEHHYIPPLLAYIPIIH